MANGKRKTLRKLFFDKQKGLCHYCKKQTKLPTGAANGVLDHDHATLDHVLPKSKGGKTTEANSVMACYECNHKRGNVMACPATGKKIKAPPQTQAEVKAAAVKEACPVRTPSFKWKMLPTEFVKLLSNVRNIGL